MVQNLALVQKVEKLAEAKGVKPGQLALAWVHAQVQLSFTQGELRMRAGLHASNYISMCLSYFQQFPNASTVSSESLVHLYECR